MKLELERIPSRGWRFAKRTASGSGLVFSLFSKAQSWLNLKSRPQDLEVDDCDSKSGKWPRSFGESLYRWALRPVWRNSRVILSEFPMWHLQVLVTRVTCGWFVVFSPWWVHSHNHVCSCHVTVNTRLLCLLIFFVSLLNWILTRSRFRATPNVIPSTWAFSFQSNNLH